MTNLLSRSFADLVSGETDFAIVGGDQFLAARSQGEPLVAIAVIFQKNPYVYVSLKSSGIERPQDLVGKRVMVAPDAEFQHRALLYKLDIAPGAIDRVPYERDVTPLITGQVDAQTVYRMGTGLAFDETGYELNWIWMEDYGIHFYADTIVTGEALIQQNPDLVERFLRATVKGWRYAIESPDEAVDLTLQYDPTLTRDRQTRMMAAQTPLIHTGKVNIGWMRAGVWREMQDILLEQAYSRCACRPGGSHHAAVPAKRLWSRRGVWRRVRGGDMKHLWHGLTIRLLIFFLLLAIVPLVVIGYVAYGSGRQSIVNNVEAHLASVAIMKQQETENWVQHVEHAITWLASSPQVVSGAATLATRAAGDPEALAAHDAMVTEFRRMTALGHLSLLSLLDSDSGQIIASSDTRWEGQFRENEPWFIRGKTGITASEIFHSLGLEQPTMVIAAPVTDSDGQLLGVLAGHANLEDLSEIMLERSGLGKTGETFLVNSANLLLTDTVFAPDGAFKKWIFGQGAERALRGENGVGQFIDYREQPVIGAYRWLEDTKLALIAKQDQAEAFAPIAALRNTVLGIGVGVALVVALLGLVFARSITRPVLQLAAGAEEIGQGNLDVRIQVRSRNEIGQLSLAFNQMAQDLKAVTASRDELNLEIAARAGVEEALQESEALLRVTGRMAKVGGWEIDADTGEVLWTEETYRIHQVPLDQKPGLQEAIDFFHPDDRDRLSNAIERALDRGEPYDMEVRFITATGKQIWTRTQCEPEIVDGKTVRLAGTLQDITERRLAEDALQKTLGELRDSRATALNMMMEADQARSMAEQANENLRTYQDQLEELVEERTGELREAQEQLVRREKLAILGQLAGGVGHELRNPLGAIKNAAYFLDMVLQDPDVETREMLEVLEKEVDTSEKIISSLLDFARAKPPIRRKVDVNDAIQEALSRHPPARHAERRGGAPARRGPAPHRGRSRSALPGLWQHHSQRHPGHDPPPSPRSGGKQGGRLVVRTALESPDWVAVSFSDTGAGISEENMKKIFEPLFTTKAKGIGLGLAISKNLIEANGGRIEVLSKEGEGTTFTVILPTIENPTS